MYSGIHCIISVVSQMKSLIFYAPYPCTYIRLYVYTVLISLSVGHSHSLPLSTVLHSMYRHHDVVRYLRTGRLNVVRYLVTEAHCDPNVKNNSGWTPLHYACQ